MWEPFRPAYTEDGFLEERTGIRGVAPKLTNDVWDRYLIGTRHYLAYAPVLKETNKILRDQRFQEAVKLALGPGFNLFKNMNQYLASGGSSASEGILSRMMALMRANIISSSIALRPTLFIRKLATDAANCFFADKNGGTKWLNLQKDYGLSMTWVHADKYGRVTDYTLFNPKLKALVDQIHDMDPYMKASARDFSFNARELARIYKNNNPVVAFLKHNAYIAERSADRALRYPKYWDVYNKELSNGATHEEAMRTAAKEVDRILGSASPIHHIGPMRGGELEKQLTPVIAFATNQFGQWWIRYRKGMEMYESSKPGSWMKTLLTIAGATVLYFVYNSLMKWGLVETGKAIANHHTKHDDPWGDLSRDIAQETSQGIPFAGYLTYGLTASGDTGFDLPVKEYLMDWKTILRGKEHFGKQIPGIFNPQLGDENWWHQELQAVSGVTGFPKSVENMTMNFVDHLNGRYGLWEEWNNMFSKWQPVKHGRRERILP